MQGLETGLFALSLLAVPGLAWFAGRALGRRDRAIGAVLVSAGLVAALVAGVRFAVLAVADGSQLSARPRPFIEALLDRVTTASGTPGPALFFAAIAVFVAMLGWAGTPIAAPKSDADPAPDR